MNHENIHILNSCSRDINIRSITQDDINNAIHKTMDKTNPDSNNGMITSIWGPHAWEYAHSVSFNYPIEPTDEDKKIYYNFFILFGETLPCGLCVKSYRNFISEGDTKLTMDIFTSRKTLTKWLFEIHNKVNQKLGVDYKETYGELCYKYESYRAKCDPIGMGCRMPLDDKAKSYQKSEIRRAPVINIEYSKQLISYAKMIDFDNYEKFLTYFSSLERNSDEWLERDRLCRKIINHIRKFGLNPTGFKGLPLKCELVLNSMLSTSISIDRRNKIINRLKKIEI
jgi:hypothetical protein